MPLLTRSYEGPGYKACLSVQSADTAEHAAFVDHKEYVEFAMGQALRDLADKVERMRADVAERQKGKGR